MLVHTPSMLQWKLSCSLKFVNREGGPRCKMKRDTLTGAPQAQNKSIETSVSRRNLCLSHLFLYHSSTSTSQLLLAKQRNWKSFPSVLTGCGCSAFSTRAAANLSRDDAMSCGVGVLAESSATLKTYLRLNCHLKEPHSMDIPHTYIQI